MGSTETGRSGLKYWLVIGFLIVFGLLTIFSIPCETSTPPYPHTWSDPTRS